MHMVERRRSSPSSKFPLFGVIYLTLLAWKYCAEAGITSIKPYIMTKQLNFSEDFALVVIHSQMAGSNMMMCIGSILADLYCGAYHIFIAQEVIRLFLTYPLCVTGVLGYLPLGVRRVAYLSGQGAAVFATFGMGSLNALVAEQFSASHYNQFLELRSYILLFFTFLGVLILPQLVVAIKCLQSDSCYCIPWVMDWVIGLLILFLFLFTRNILYIPRRRKSEIIISMQLLTQWWRETRRKETLISPPTEEDSPETQRLKLHDLAIKSDATKILSLWKFFLTLSCFWALHCQYNTTWIFQAGKLEGSLHLEMKNFHLALLSKQVWGIVPLFGLLFLPLMTLLLRNAKCPLRVITASQLVMAIAFFVATYLEFHIISFCVDNCSDDADEIEINPRPFHRYWTIPQLVLVSFSEITFTLSYKLFTFHLVPKSMQHLTRNMFILSKILGHILVALVLLCHYYSDFPSRQAQYMFYSVLLCSFIIYFSLMNNDFDKIIDEDS